MVEVLNQVLGELSHARAATEKPELVEQIFLQRLRPGHHVGHGVVLAVAFVLHAVAGRAVVLAERLAVVLRERLEAVEVEFAGVVDD